jgi:hypothetical protein
MIPSDAMGPQDSQRRTGSPASGPRSDAAHPEPSGMQASTHTEIYRRFRGALQPSFLRAMPLFSAGWRVATKKKLALVLFFPPAIATVVFSFIVYGKFALESGITPAALGGDGSTVNAIGAAASTFIEVRDQIVLCNMVVSLFALLIMAWYGAGLIAEDRRLGAHLLYFARPMTHVDYVIGKFLIVGSFGLLTVLVPGLVICTVAALASPHASFLTQQSSVILHTIAYGALWTVVISSTILAISSLVERKTYALVGAFGFFSISQGIAVLLSGLQHDKRWMMLGPIFNLRRVAMWMFGVTSTLGRQADWNIAGSWWSLAALIALSWTILWVRVKRMEVVA